MGWNYLSIRKLQRLGMDKLFHSTLYNGCNYLPMLELLIHVNSRVPGRQTLRHVSLLSLWYFFITYLGIKANIWYFDCHPEVPEYLGDSATVHVCHQGPFQYPIRRLIVRSREVSKPRDLYLELSDRWNLTNTSAALLCDNLNCHLSGSILHAILR